jgi:WD40 repeat protein
MLLDGALIGVKSQSFEKRSTVDTIESEGCVCVWDLERPDRPLAILCGCPVACGVWGPKTAGILFLGGCYDGSVSVWDIRKALQIASKGDAAKVPFFPPVCSSARLALDRCIEEGMDAIVDVHVVPGSFKVRTAELSEFAVLALSGSGVLAYWAVELNLLAAGSDVHPPTVDAAASGVQSSVSRQAQTSRGISILALT